MLLKCSDLELQLSELEMLRSMFPGEGEVLLEDPAAEAEWRSWLQRHQGEDHVETPEEAS